MVDATAIKKKKKKRAVIATTIVSSIVVIALIIVAFLSSYVGNFTISVVNWESKIALAVNPPTGGSSDETTTYLKAPGFGSAVPVTVSNNSVLEDGTFDSDVGGEKSTIYNDQRGVTATQFYVFTFYVKNVGDSLIQYYYGFNITGEGESNGKKISDMIRIRVYQNLYTGDEATTTHNYVDYTRENTGYIYDDEPLDTRSYLDSCASEVSAGTLKYFADSSTIIVSDDSPYRLEQDGIIRYTYVIWIEGNDPDCSGDFLSSSMRLTSFLGSRSADEETA